MTKILMIFIKTTGNLIALESNYLIDFWILEKFEEINGNCILIGFWDWDIDSLWKLNDLKISISNSKIKWF
jgi:hypothetical protein